MGIEIERKFKVHGDRWRAPADGERISQGYIPAEKAQIRVRLKGSSAYLTIKSRDLGISRAEFEYAIPVRDAEELLESFARKPFIEKTRYNVTVGGRVWEIDEFHGAYAGMVIAEVELESADAEVELPDWVSEEVTGDIRFTNEYLAAQLSGPDGE